MRKSRTRAVTPSTAAGRLAASANSAQWAGRRVKFYINKYRSVQELRSTLDNFGLVWLGWLGLAEFDLV